MMKLRFLGAGRLVALVFAGLLAWLPVAHAARDASFLAPTAVTSGGKSGSGDESIGVEPKGEIDLGETNLNVGKRMTIFFVNLTNLPIQIESVTANGDGNVLADIVVDDCTREGRIAASSRCSVTVEATPKSAGTWTAEILMTHKAAGRLARAKLSGRTPGATGERKIEGLSLSAKDIKPVDFGDVDVGTGKAVRSALMVNDSTETITLLSIELIAADNGLTRLEQGCVEDMDLRPGESCPVTMLWKPEGPGDISTDLILRHSGRFGFAVIPVRGVAKGSSGAAAGRAKTESIVGPKDKDSASPLSKEPPALPTAEELQKMMGDKLPSVGAGLLPQSSEQKASAGSGESVPKLIGTVGRKAVMYLGAGKTRVMNEGDDAQTSEGQNFRLDRVSGRMADIDVAGKTRTLTVQSVQAIKDRAAQTNSESKHSRASQTDGGSSGPSSIVPLPKGM